MKTRMAEAIDTLAELTAQSMLAHNTMRANCSCGGRIDCPWYLAWHETTKPVEEYERRIAETFPASEAHAIVIRAYSDAHKMTA